MSPTSKALEGLSKGEAERRLAQYGPNVLQHAPSRGLMRIALGTLREPMFLFLLVAAGLYLFIGDIGEGLFLVLGAVVSIGLVIVQEARSEGALAALQELAQPTARVIRGTVESKIPAHDLVPGDVVLIGEGERIAADATLVAGDLLTVDESALTGEAVPVNKSPIINAVAEEPRVEGKESNSDLFAGTLVVRGQGTAIVVATGQSTVFGKIGLSLATIQSEPTLLQRTLARVVARLGILAILFCAVVFVAYGVFRGEWIQGALGGLTLAIALLPEEFPMVLAIFMALGAWRLARRRVLVRRGAVIETLGAATILCVDKTGTLTENRMEVAELWTGNTHIVTGQGAFDEDAGQLVARAALASATRPTDPMDRAIRRLVQTTGAEAETSTSDEPVETHPLRPGLLAMFQVWQAGGDYLIAAKGAPEAIFQICRMDEGMRAGAEAETEAMAGRGLRVLGVASRQHDGGLPDDPATVSYRFEGLVGFLDPVRSDVAAALADARSAGIHVAMITGDYPATALEIAKQSGIDVHGGMLTGGDIERLGQAELRDRVRSVRVFARVRPHQKLVLVEALKANGEVVAMTGDGINDAPALEAAHIGIAMGQRGTDVAREAADIVLLDDSFAAIVDGVRLGRRIFANLRKALVYVTAVHMPTAFLALTPIIFGLPPILFPMHVVLVEMVIDPVCSIVFEAEPSEKEAMKKPPRPRGEGLFGRRQLALAFLQGGVVSLAVLLLYVVALRAGLPDVEARAMAFVALVVANLILAFADSAEVGTSFFDRRRVAFWAIGFVTTAILALILYVPTLSDIFNVERPDLPALLTALVVALFAGGWFGFLRRTGIVGGRHPRHPANVTIG